MPKGPLSASSAFLGGDGSISLEKLLAWGRVLASRLAETGDGWAAVIENLGAEDVLVLARPKTSDRLVLSADEEGVHIVLEGTSMRFSISKEEALARGPSFHDNLAEAAILLVDLAAAAHPHPHPRRMLRSSRRTPSAEVDATAPIEVGTRVRVIEGTFMGRTGEVKELDGKGAARVMMGLFAARIDVKNLMALAPGKVRPMLGSSHRKPS